MSCQAPFWRLTGTLKLYASPITAGVAIAEPDMGAAVPGTWTELGPTEDDQIIRWSGQLTGFSDNDSNGPRKMIRPDEGLSVQATVASMTLEQRAIVMGLLTSSVVDEDSYGTGSLSTKVLQNSRGRCPQLWSLLLRGGASDNHDSPYGLFPAQRYVPIGVFDGEPQETRGKNSSPGMQFTYRALWDSAQSAGRELGWLRVQDA